MKLTGGEIVSEYLIREGVPYIVGIPGHGCLGLVDAFLGKEKSIKVLQVRHEQSAVHLADGYYRASGKPLAVFTSIGPGAINTAVGVATCFVDSTPVLVITGDTHTHMFGKGVLQEIERSHDANSSRIFEPIVKRWWQVNKVEQLPSILRRAFNQMLTGRKGPVLINLPMDVQSDSAEIDVSKIENRRPEGKICGDTKEIEKAVDLLLKARRPAILAGGGVIASEAYDELKELAELLGAAVITTMMGKSSFPENHPLYAWHAGSKGTTCGNKIASSADVILAVGCRFADETASSYKNGVSFSIPPTKLIHIDLDPTEIGKNYPIEVGIVGDAKAILKQTVQNLKLKVKNENCSGRACSADKEGYYKEIQRLRESWFEEMRPFRESNDVPVTISRFLKELREFLDKDGIVVTSSGNAQAQILQEFPFYLPKTLITTGGFSTMGFTLPAAIGVKLASPDKQVIGVLGDGDFLMTIQELSTAVQYNIPVVITVLNNFAWQAITDLQISAYGKERIMGTEFRKEDGKLYSPDFTSIAKGFGCYGERIDKPEEVKPALKRAFASRRPAVIEVTVDRDVAGKVTGWWDVPIPTYLKKERKKYEEERKGEKL